MTVGDNYQFRGWSSFISVQSVQNNVKAMLQSADWNFKSMTPRICVLCPAGLRGVMCMHSKACSYNQCGQLYRTQRDKHGVELFILPAGSEASPQTHLSFTWAIHFRDSLRSGRRVWDKQWD